MNIDTIGPGGQRVGIPMNVWNGSAATERLEQTMIDLAGKTDRQTRQLVLLTWALVILTVGIFALTAVLVVHPGG